MSDGTAQTVKFTLTTDDGRTVGPFQLPDAAKPYRFSVDLDAKSLRLVVVESSGTKRLLRVTATNGIPGIRPTKLNRKVRVCAGHCDVGCTVTPRQQPWSCGCADVR
jgi:hypothetical protein